MANIGVFVGGSRYVMEMGREVLQGPAAELANNPKIKEPSAATA